MCVQAQHSYSIVYHSQQVLGFNSSIHKKINPN